MTEEKKEVKVNGQEVSEQELKEMQENQDKNTKLIESGKDEYIQRLND